MPGVYKTGPAIGHDTSSAPEHRIRDEVEYELVDWKHAP